MDRTRPNQASIVIGVDPDSDKHGVAIYKKGQLHDIDNCRLTDFIEFLPEMMATDNVVFVIEDVCSKNAVYKQRLTGKAAIDRSMGRSLGLVQQSQKELMRLLDWYEIEYYLLKPQKGNWAKNKKEFERMTGWTKRSNEDNRSAAFFGFLGLNNGKRLW